MKTVIGMKKSTGMMRVPVTTCFVEVMLVMGWCSMASGATLFYDDFSEGMKWTTSDSSVSIINDNLVIGSDGDNDDWAEKAISIDLLLQSPIIIEQRAKLVSGGLGYLLPDVSVFFEDSSSISMTYASDSGQSLGWYFAGWTGNYSNAVPGEDYWTVTKMVLTPTGGKLYVESDDEVAEASWSHTSINRIRIDQPWDSVNYVDYVSITPEPATLTLLALGGLAVLRRRRKQ